MLMAVAGLLVGIGGFMLALVAFGSPPHKLTVAVVAVAAILAGVLPSLAGNVLYLGISSEVPYRRRLTAISRVSGSILGGTSVVAAVIMFALSQPAFGEWAMPVIAGVVIGIALLITYQQLCVDL